MTFEDSTPNRFEGMDPAEFRALLQGTWALHDAVSFAKEHHHIAPGEEWINDALAVMDEGHHLVLENVAVSISTLIASYSIYHLMTRTDADILIDSDFRTAIDEIVTLCHVRHINRFSDSYRYRDARLRFFPRNAMNDRIRGFRPTLLIVLDMGSKSLSEWDAQHLLLMSKRPRMQMIVCGDLMTPKVLSDPKYTKNWNRIGLAYGTAHPLITGTAGIAERYR